MEDDAFEDIGSAAARVVMGVARPGVTPDACEAEALNTTPELFTARLSVGTPAARGVRPNILDGTSRYSPLRLPPELKGVAPAGGGPASAAQAGTGEARRAHNSGGGTAVVLKFRLRERTTARAVGSPVVCARV